MDQVKKKKTDDWTMAELGNVLKHIQKGKSRDADGISREFFLPSVIGDNLKESLLLMLNKLKHEGKIPNFMKNTIIIPIPKKGSQFHLKNKRGVFIVNCVRGILMKLIYNSKYHIIDENTSERNIGSRKNRS